MINSKKLFVSLPMRDRKVSEIRADMQYLTQIANEEFDENFDLIDTIWDDISDSDEIQYPECWYLGRSLMGLSEADIVVFHPEWRSARGCIIEHMVCALYNIPYIDITMDYSLTDIYDDVDDYTHDWNTVGEIDAMLSEQLAKEEGLDDILDDEDVEDALGFEHNDVDDLIDSDIDILEPGEYDADE